MKTSQTKVVGKHPVVRMARRAAVCLLLSLIAVLPLPALAGCSRPPELDTVRDRFGELIEASGEVNDLLWGEGLPYYEKDSDYAKETGLYEGTWENLGNYRYVTLEALAKYPSVEDIRAAAGRVYSEAFLSDVGASLFEGNMITTGEISMVSRARYAEINQNLCILVDWDKGFEYHRPTYDLSTMQIVKKLSSADIVTVTVECVRDDREAPFTVTLRFVSQDGDWRLDSPTY